MKRLEKMGDDRMLRKMKVWTAVAALVAGVLAGCSGSKEAHLPPNPNDQLRPAMMRSLDALDEVTAKLKGGDVAGGQEAYAAFVTAFGEVLGPISLDRPELAQKMANANSAIKVAMAKKKPDAAAVARDAGTITMTMQESAQAFGFSLVARASARAGQGVTPAVKTRTVEVHAREYSFTPNRIEVEKGTRLTVRLVNDGTKNHEWEVEALDKEIKPIPPGTSAELTFVVDKPGSHEFVCNVDDHAERGLLVIK